MPSMEPWSGMRKGTEEGPVLSGAGFGFAEDIFCKGSTQVQEQNPME